MAIVNSIIESDQTQEDGRRRIREAHLESDGKTRRLQWLADASVDVESVMMARVSALEERLVINEIEQNINIIKLTDDTSLVLSMLTFRYATVTQTATRLREDFRDATGDEAARIAKLFLSQSDARLILIFDITQAKVDILRPRLQKKERFYIYTGRFD